MIVKSMPRTAPSFHQLLHYIAAGGRGAGEPLLHNLRADGRDLAAVNRAFNADYGMARPSLSVELYSAFHWR